MSFAHKVAVGTRYAIVGSLFFLPKSRQVLVERWLRGREEHVRTQAADRILMSWGKSGRTWLRVMLSRFYQTAYGIPEDTALEFDNLKRLNPKIPSVYFTHGNYLRNYTGDWNNRTDFYGKKVLMLVRDPRDVAVSQYFQWKFRMHRRKKALNSYPPHGAEVDLFDFVTREYAGLPSILDFFEIWERELPKVAGFLVVRYEDLRAEPHAELKKIVEFFGTPGSDEEIADAVEYASVDNLRRLEKEASVGFSGQRLVAKDKNNPDSFKVRRAKVGGYRDYFDDAQLEVIDRMVTERGVPLFGYAKTEESDRAVL